MKSELCDKGESRTSLLALPSRSKVEALRSFGSKVWCASREINYLETAGTTETTGTTEKFIIILMILCFAVVSFVSVVSCGLKKKPSKAQDPNFLSEGVRLGLDKEIAPDGTYLAYFPFGAMIERSRMTPYHKKLVDKMLKRFHNITRVKHNSLGLGKYIEEEHISR